MAQHVVPRDGGWAVRRGGSGRVTRRYGTLLEAIDAELKLARKQKTELDLHGEDGLIRERRSFAENRSPPAG